MKDLEFNVLMRKAEELKALFILGQRVIPFLEEIFVFVKDIKPLLDDINVSIEENIKKMPNASKQLSKVTEATELATNEIMDIVDGLVYKSDIIKSNLKKLSDLYNTNKNNPNKMLELIISLTNGSKEAKDVLPELTKLIDSYKNNNSNQFNEVIEDTNGILNSINDDSSAIMMSLQVQDITSQQIAAVNHLLETIQHKLGSILKKFQSSEISEIMSPEETYGKSNQTKLHRDISFDPEAIDSISNKSFRQDNVDSLIAEHQNSNDDDDSEIDIDALFSNQNNQINQSNQNNHNQDKELNNFKEIKPNDNDFDHFSQDDIDLLFGK